MSVINNVKGTTGGGSGIGSMSPQSKTGSNEGFQRVASQVGTQPPASLPVLGKGEISMKERQRISKEITQRVINNPSHPYSKISADLRNEMIERVADVLAEAPIPLPKLKG